MWGIPWALQRRGPLYGATMASTAAPTNPGRSITAAPTTSSEERQRALDQVFALTRKASDAYHRPDLSRRVDEIAERLRQREVVAVVAGDYKQGKSSMVNALLRMSVCPVDHDLATASPTAISYSSATTVTAVRAGGDAEEPVRQSIPFADLRATVAPGPDHVDRDLLGVEVGVPAPLLEAGLVVVDCPGDGGLGSMGRMSSLAQVAGAAALLFVSDATSELTATEVSFLQVAAKVCPVIVLVMTKIDLAPAWREVQERNRFRLEEAGLGRV
jgi:hypothetical protein